MSAREVRETGRRLTELRRSNAAGPHPHRGTKRNRARADQRRHAIRESVQS